MHGELTTMQTNLNIMQGDLVAVQEEFTTVHDSMAELRARIDQNEAVPPSFRGTSTGGWNDGGGNDEAYSNRHNGGGYHNFEAWREDAAHYFNHHNEERRPNRNYGGKGTMTPQETSSTPFRSSMRSSSPPHT